MQAPGDTYHAVQGHQVPACRLGAREGIVRATVSGEATLNVVFCVIW